MSLGEGIGEAWRWRKGGEEKRVGEGIDEEGWRTRREG